MTIEANAPKGINARGHHPCFRAGGEDDDASPASSPSSAARFSGWERGAEGDKPFPPDSWSARNKSSTTNCRPSTVSGRPSTVSTRTTSRTNSPSWLIAGWTRTVQGSGTSSGREGLPGELDPFIPSGEPGATVRTSEGPGTTAVTLPVSPPTRGAATLRRLASGDHGQEVTRVPRADEDARLLVITGTGVAMVMGRPAGANPATGAGARRIVNKPVPAGGV